MFRSVKTCMICIFSFALCQETMNYRDVEISQGPIRGYREGNIFVFYSIQYATVPTGRDFYKNALPPPTWNTTFDATEQNILCQQPVEVAAPPFGYQVKEQCLIANVFVPENITKDLPVVVYVHGGGYQIGSGNRLTPRNLVGTGEVISVTFNYRLGPQGFLCLGTDTVPGNSGMKDMVKLLKWVQKDIHNFGGNPKEVTIAGYSAGSAAVDVLLLSKMTDGLFNKVIIESGANLNAFSVQIDPLENAKWFAKNLGFNNTNDISALENFYLNTPYDILSSYTAPLLTRPDGVMVFAPCVEKDLGQEMFLDKSPAELLESGNFKKLPLLYGISDFDGLLHIDSFEKWKRKMNENFLYFVPQDIGHNKKDREKLAKKLKSFYFGRESVSDNNVLKYIDYFSDVMIKYGTMRSAKLQLRAGNDKIYLYDFTFVDESQPFIPHTNIRGAMHCAQTAAVLDLHIDEDKLSDEYKSMKTIIRKLWANFIAFGNPVPEGYDFPSWPPMTSNLSYMILNTTSEYKHAFVYENMKFWDDIVNKFYKYPSAPNPNVDNSYIFP
ncbi:esterase E4-like [Pieris rapae]|uniref:esterase E4-like n=1 Tax=Pieris rapae TaxID=64459 RepID=UPI001E27E635|nr:esterase E4-like [Pieris rapae]